MYSCSRYYNFNSIHIVYCIVYCVPMIGQRHAKILNERAFKFSIFMPPHPTDVMACYECYTQATQLFAFFIPDFLEFHSFIPVL